MAKKDLSGAKGLDALFQRPPAAKPETSAPEIQEGESKKENIVQQKAKIRRSKKSAAPRTKPMAEKKESTSTFSVNLNGLRKAPVEYTSIRLERSLFERLQRITKKERLKSTNKLVITILEAYCEGYENS